MVPITKHAADTCAHVLVVDDDGDMLDLARMLLEPSGLVVDTAADGAVALAMARSEAYDVVVTDISMPYMDGIELGNALRGDPATAESMVIVHSALNEAWVHRFFSGYDLFLAKPHKSGKLAMAVAELLHERQLQHGTPRTH